MCANRLLCPDNKHTYLYFQLSRFQINTRKQGPIILLHSRGAGHSPALSWSSRLVAARMMCCGRSWSTGVQISSRYECAHVHIMRKYVVAYQFREKVYQVCKHRTVLRTWVVFCYKQWEKDRHMYIHNYHNTPTKIPTIKYIFSSLSAHYMQLNVLTAVKIRLHSSLLCHCVVQQYISSASKKPAASVLRAGMGWTMHFQNVGKHLPEYMVSQITGPQSHHYNHKNTPTLHIKEQVRKHMQVTTLQTHLLCYCPLSFLCNLQTVCSTLLNRFRVSRVPCIINCLLRFNF